MLVNIFSRNKNRKIMKNQDGGFKVPLFDRKPSECHVRCQSLIGSYASTCSTFNLIGPYNNIQTPKATKIHTLKPLTYELFFQNGSTKRVLIAGVSSSLLPFLPISYPFRRLLLRLTTPPRIRLLAHNLLAHVKFNKYSIVLSPPPPREITINSLTLNLKTWCYRYKEQSNFVWPILNNLENDQVFIITSIAWTSQESQNSFNTGSIRGKEKESYVLL